MKRTLVLLSTILLLFLFASCQKTDEGGLQGPLLSDFELPSTLEIDGVVSKGVMSYQNGIYSFLHQTQDQTTCGLLESYENGEYKREFQGMQYVFRTVKPPLGNLFSLLEKVKNEEPASISEDITEGKVYRNVTYQYDNDIILIVYDKKHKNPIKISAVLNEVEIIVTF